MKITTTRKTIYPIWNHSRNISQDEAHLKPYPRQEDAHCLLKIQMRKTKRIKFDKPELITEIQDMTSLSGATIGTYWTMRTIFLAKLRTRPMRLNSAATRVVSRSVTARSKTKDPRENDHASPSMIPWTMTTRNLGMIHHSIPFLSIRLALGG
jgi:hypothetical protein